MAKFFFEIHDGQPFPDDEEGTECTDLAMVREEALRTSLEMLREHPSVWDGEPWRMKVRDEAGLVVAQLKFTAR